MRNYLIASLVLTGIAAGGAAALASSDGVSDRPRQPRIVIEQAVALAKHRIPGTVIEAELERHGVRGSYEVKIEDPDGRIHRLRFDAHTAERL